MTDLTVADGALAPVPSRAQIKALIHCMKQHPQADCPLTHHWADGVYGREMFAAAGTLIVGAEHRRATLNVLLQGRIKVTDADGAVREMSAPAVYVTPAGCQKVGLVLEDVRWLNVLPTKLTDLSAIEAKFTVPETPMIEVET